MASVSEKARKAGIINVVCAVRLAGNDSVVLVLDFRTFPPPAIDGSAIKLTFGASKRQGCSCRSIIGANNAMGPSPSRVSCVGVLLDACSPRLSVASGQGYVPSWTGWRAGWARSINLRQAVSLNRHDFDAPFDIGRVRQGRSRVACSYALCGMSRWHAILNIPMNNLRTHRAARRRLSLRAHWSGI